jgi:hypothetical protein
VAGEVVLLAGIGLRGGPGMSLVNGRRATLRG